MRSAVSGSFTGYAGVWGEGADAPFLGLGAFHIPVMALSALPTGCSTDFGDNRQSSGWVYIVSNALSPELPSVSIQTTWWPLPSGRAFVAMTSFHSP